MRTAWIFGASGATGSELLKLASQRDAFDEWVCVNRRPLGNLPAHIKEVVIPDLGPQPLLSLAGNPSSVFICLGTTIAIAGSKAQFRRVDFDLICAVGDWAKRNGASQVHLISAIGANANAMSFYSRIKGEAENYLNALEFNSLCIYRPSVLTGATRPDNRSGERWAERVLGLFDQLSIFSGIRRVPVSTLARAMLTADEQHLSGVISSARIHQLGALNG